MAKKSGVKPEELEKRINRIKYSETIRDEADEFYGYSRSLDLYKGNFAQASKRFLAGIDIVPINEVYAFTKTFIPSVYSRDPYIACNAKGQKWIVGAKVLEMAINAYWRELKLKRQVRQCIFDGIFAEGWLKTGYSASLGDASKPDGEMAINPSTYVEDEEIFAQRISFKNMVRDPDAVDGIADARFVAQKIILPLEAVQSSSLYENTADLKANYRVEIKVPGAVDYSKQTRKVYEEYVVLWEEWNRDEEMVYTYSEGHDKFLMKKKWPYKFGNHAYPYEMIRFNHCFDEPYAPNMITPWEPQLWEKMKIRAMQLDHIKRFGRQYTVEKGAISRMEKDKLVKGITGSVIEHEQGKAPPVPLPYPPLQTDIYGVENRIDMDKDNISGQPNAVRSAPQKTTSRTLGEVDRLISSFQSRQNDPQAIVEEFSENVATKLIGLMQQYLKGERFLRVTQLEKDWFDRESKDNPISKKMDSTGFNMSAEDIKDIEFEVEVRAGSTLPMDKKNRISSMIAVIDLGEKIGIMPGDKVSRITGKNLIAEFDMPEITAAYEEVLRKIEAAEITQKVGQMANLEQVKQHGAKVHGRIQQMRGGGQGATPPANGAQHPKIPPELIS